MLMEILVVVIEIVNNGDEIIDSSGLGEKLQSAVENAFRREAFFPMSSENFEPRWWMYSGEDHYNFKQIVVRVKFLELKT